METFATPANFLSENRDRAHRGEGFYPRKAGATIYPWRWAPAKRDEGVERTKGSSRKKRAARRAPRIYRLFLFSGNLLPARI